MKFKDYAYIRPDFNHVKSEFEKLLDVFAQAPDVIIGQETFKKINALRLSWTSMSTLSSIRHSIDTVDPFYETENDYWDNQNPLYAELDTLLYKAVLDSTFRNELEAFIPKTFFQMAENALKAFDPKIIPDLQEENKLRSSYGKLIASAQIDFKGETLTLAQLYPYTLNPDRKTREDAWLAKADFFKTHEVEIDEIYDKMVKLRDQIARKLGYKDFIELGYVRMNRLDYNAQMVSVFRKQVLTDIVPLVQKLMKRQAKRLGLDHLYYYDLGYEFISGNPKPIGTPEEIIASGQKMYHQLSQETGEFIDFMIERDLLDLVAKKGKESGGYCTYISEHQSPFIFSNFNGTQGDVEVLTHEAGHAFQAYMSRWIDIPECSFPTYESAEIHSMSMEFITWPWMDQFFGKDTDKFKFSHLSSAMTFMPYGVLIDHFQHDVYANPQWSPTERKAAFRSLEKQYLPHKDYTGNDFLERGGYWFQQGHVFGSPFYYIDYTLAQICALQFFKRAQDQDPQMWNDYLNLCKVGGTKSFLELVNIAHLKSPFEEGCVASVTALVEQTLDAISDQSL
ncbi:MAG: oligoendopeptidase [Erysipelotrichaceae bacterium]|nr:MAG: oligoendopeptidase [Erysipelotrichaceae bacterium]